MAWHLVLAATRPHGLLDGARALETASPRRGSCDWPTVGGLLLPRPPCRVPRPRLRLPTALQGPSRQKHGSRKTITSTPQGPSETACIPGPVGGGAPPGGPRRAARKTGKIRGTYMPGHSMTQCHSCEAPTVGCCCPLLTGRPGGTSRRRYRMGKRARWAA